MKLGDESNTELSIYYTFGIYDTNITHLGGFYYDT